MEMHAFSECLPFVGEQTNKRHKSAFKVRPTKTKKNLFSKKLIEKNGVHRVNNHLKQLENISLLSIPIGNNL